MTRICGRCGAPAATPDARFCRECGNALPPVVPVERAVAHPSSGFAAPGGWAFAPPPPIHGAATASLILGIMTWVLPLFLIGLLTGFVTAPLALGLGIVARRAIDEEPGRWRGRGIATAGFSLGLSAMLIATLLVSLMVLARLAGSL